MKKNEEINFSRISRSSRLYLYRRLMDQINQIDQIDEMNRINQTNPLTFFLAYVYNHKGGGMPKLGQPQGQKN